MDKEFEGWVMEALGGAPPEFRQWFVSTFQRLARKVDDPRELARRLMAFSGAAAGR